MAFTLVVHTINFETVPSRPNAVLQMKRRNQECPFDRLKDRMQERDALGPDVQRREGGREEVASGGSLQAQQERPMPPVCSSSWSRGRREGTKVNCASDPQGNKECLRNPGLLQVPT